MDALNEVAADFGDHQHALIRGVPFRFRAGRRRTTWRSSEAESAIALTRLAQARRLTNRRIASTNWKTV